MIETQWSDHLKYKLNTIFNWIPKNYFKLKLVSFKVEKFCKWLNYLEAKRTHQKS